MPTYAWHVKEEPLPLSNQDNLMIAALLEPERLANSRSGWIHLFACVPEGSEHRQTWYGSLSLRDMNGPGTSSCRLSHQFPKQTIGPSTAAMYSRPWVAAIPSHTGGDSSGRRLLSDPSEME